MSVPIQLRGDFEAAQLRGLAKKTKDGPQARRLLALAAIYYLNQANQLSAKRKLGLTRVSSGPGRLEVLTGQLQPGSWESQPMEL